MGTNSIYLTSKGKYSLAVGLFIFITHVPCLMIDKIQLLGSHHGWFDSLDDPNHTVDGLPVMYLSNHYLLQIRSPFVSSIGCLDVSVRERQHLPGVAHHLYSLERRSRHHTCSCTRVSRIGHHARNGTDWMEVQSLVGENPTCISNLGRWLNPAADGWVGWGPPMCGEDMPLEFSGTQATNHMGPQILKPGI